MAWWPCIGGKKWYWMPLINCLRLLQVAAFRAYVALGHSKISQLEFLRSVVQMSVPETTLYTPSRPGRRRASVLPRRLTEDHIPEPAKKQGRCSFCKKNTRMKCFLCDFLLHQSAVCFNGFHTWRKLNRNIDFSDLLAKPWLSSFVEIDLFYFWNILCNFPLGAALLFWELLLKSKKVFVS